MDRKQCSTCKESKPLKFFHKEKCGKYGVKKVCNDCRKRVYQDNIQWYKDYALKNKERLNAQKKVWHNNRSEKQIIKDKIRNNEWIKNNPDIIRRAQKNFYDNNPGYLGLKAAVQAIKKYKRAKCIPTWLTKQHWTEMREIYALRDELQWLSEEKLHVDHIIPINGSIICGLHVPDNLQILPASLNLKKGNKFP